MASSRVTRSSSRKQDLETVIAAEAGNLAPTVISKPKPKPKSTKVGQKKKALTTRSKNAKKQDPAPSNPANVLDTATYEECLVEVEPNIICDESPQASGVSVEACHSTRGTSLFTCSPSKIYYCEKCPRKSFSTKHGLARHLMNHRMEDANAKRPSAETLKPLVESFVTKGLKEISQEPGEEKKKCVLSVLKAVDIESSGWSSVLEIMSAPLLCSLSTPTKVLPSNQYEEQLIFTNEKMNDEVFVRDLLNALKLLVRDENFSDKTLKMVLYRVSSKLVNDLCKFVFDEMVVNKEEVELSAVREMTEVEKDAFVLHTRKLLQEYYKKGLQFGTKLWIARCACIRQCFISSTELNEAPTVDAFLNNSSWEEDGSGVVKLKLNETVVSFFLDLERIIEAQIRKQIQVSSDNVMDVVFQTHSMLDKWYSVTKNYFSEMEALLFLKDIVVVIILFSLKLEAGRLRDLQAQDRIQKYALRTDLKRN
ncbi:Zinc finger protein 646 [Frankliniella fusca]|uniref:Zinc finger protein 646 n=1 Tax=Frankliniella fusca TaxID=407009 RepID=A0AAE1I4P8_9NEOP|nr:Zinc finger protein 646 [Frankliniella fusca]